jgi:hypothetical protein
LGVKVGQVLGRYKVGKHFECQIGEGSFAWSRRHDSIDQEARLDGIYVLRTSEPAERLSAEDTVRSYKSLAEVERAFRCLKGIDLLVRPIRHRTEDRGKRPAVTAFTGAYFSLPIGLLCRVALAPGLGVIAVRG